MSTLIAVGRCGRDGELRSLQDGSKVLSFSIAEDIGYGDKRKTQWISCALFGPRAEKVAPYVTKGTLVEVIGQPSINMYEGKNGHKADLQVRVQELKLHGGGKKDDGSPAENPKPQPRRIDEMQDEVPW